MVDGVEIQEDRKQQDSKALERARKKSIRKDIEFEWLFGSGFESPSTSASISALEREGRVVKDSAVKKWKFSYKKQISI